MPLAAEWVEGAKRFTNKLWNIVGFALRVLDDTRPGELPPRGDLALEDRWILSSLERTRAQVEDAYATWDYARISAALYHLAWDELADWYLEAVKPRVYGDDPQAKADRPGRPRPGPRRPPAAAAPDDPVRHRGAVAGPDRARRAGPSR